KLIDDNYIKFATSISQICLAIDIDKENVKKIFYDKYKYDDIATVIYGIEEIKEIKEIKENIIKIKENIKKVSDTVNKTWDNKTWNDKTKSETLETLETNENKLL